MFDFGWGELLLIGIVALIVVGDDFPSMFRQLGRFTGKMRRMAREFQRAMEEAADEAGVKDAANTFRDAANPTRMGLNKLTEAADKFEKWDPVKASKKAKGIGPETEKLSEERAEAKKKILEYSTKKTNERIAAEKAATEAEVASEMPEPEAPAAPEAKDGA